MDQLSPKDFGEPVTFKDKARAFYKKYERWVPLTFFLLGFAIDIISLGRIDSLAGILQQALYLVIAGTLIGLELLHYGGAFTPPPGRFEKFWKYREPVTHFLLGSLLSVYTLFYFKSSSSFASFAFVALLGVLLVVNEFVKFDETGTTVRMTLFSLCKISYFLYLVPVVLGFIGVVPFFVSIFTSAVALIPLYLMIRRRITNSAPFVRQRVLVPFLAIQAAFIVGYFTQWIPPVPLSVSYIGIYHDIKKENGKYHLAYTRPWWKFWQNGDQSFLARPGDKIHCFARIFSPTRFKDQIQVRWLYKDERHGWQRADAIPLEIVGGREEGFRGYTTKANYAPGDWRVQIETTDGREIGRIYFTIETDAGTDTRQARVDIH